MLAVDFVYDGIRLSDLGYSICQFSESGGVSTAEIGSEITFTMIQRRHGERYSMSNAAFNKCLTYTFQICKNPDQYLSQLQMEITDEEFRNLMRWLNRRSFHEMQFIGENQLYSCFYNASFNLAKVNISGTTYGVEITMQTDRPFGYQKRSLEINNVTNSEYTNHEITVYSDDICDIYPDLVITCNGAGNIILKNDPDSPTCFTEIDNCVSGEIITISGDALTIVSDTVAHDVANDFNYDWFRIPFESLTENHDVTISVQGNCVIELSYKQITKEIF